MSSVTVLKRTYFYGFHVGGCCVVAGCDDGIVTAAAGDGTV